MSVIPPAQRVGLGVGVTEKHQRLLAYLSGEKDKDRNVLAGFAVMTTDSLRILFIVLGMLGTLILYVWF